MQSKKQIILRQYDGGIFTLYNYQISKEGPPLLEYTKHEASDMSIATFAPKGKMYSMKNNRLYRVSVATGIHIWRNGHFWKNTALLLGFGLDTNIITMLQSTDKKL